MKRRTKTTMQRIDEATMQQALSALLKNKYSASQLISLMKFSPSWTTEMSMSKWTAKFDSDIARDHAVEMLEKAQASVHSNQNAGQTFEASMKLAGKMQGMVMKNLVPHIPHNTNIRFKNGEIQISGSKDVVEKALSVAYAVQNGLDPKQPLDPQVVEQLFKQHARALASTQNEYSIEASGPFDVIQNVVDDSWHDVSCQLSQNDSYLDQATKSMVSFLDGMVSKLGSVDDVVSKARKHKMFQLYGILKTLNDTKLKSNPKPLESFGSIEELDQFIHSAFTVSIAETMPDASKVINPLAKRRLKLFEDLKHYGGKVYSNGGWMCGVCYTIEQNHIFGRWKPAVDENGDIIELANKRDDELDVLVSRGKLATAQAAQYKKIRDSGAHDRITKNEATNWKTETRWCTTGSISQLNAWHYSSRVLDDIKYWYSYNAKVSGITSQQIGPEYRNPYWVFMNLQNGTLFQYSRYLRNGRMSDCCLDENDRSTDGITKDVHGEEGLVSHMANTFPDFKAMFDEISPANKEIIEYLDSVELDDDGALVITDSTDMATIYTILKSPTLSPSKIRIKCANAASMFKSRTMTGVTMVDMAQVVDAQMMFCQAKLNRSLTIVGSQNCKNMFEMFCESNGLVDVKGLNTSSATSLQRIFYSAKSKNDLDMHIPTLDLRNCSNIERAFAYSNVSEINLKNYRKVVTAQSYFLGCTHLQKLPILEFPSIMSIYYLANNIYLDKSVVTSKPLHEMLLSCTKLISSNDDKARMKELADHLLEYYSGQTKERLQSLVDEDGFVTIASQEQAMAIKDAMPYVKKLRLRIPSPPITYSGVSHSVWYGSSSDYPLRHLAECEVIDISGITNGEALFAYANLTNVKQIIGLEDVENATSMFLRANMPATPIKMYFKNVKKCHHIFFGIFDEQGKIKIDAKFGPHLLNCMMDYDSIFGSVPHLGQALLELRQLARDMQAEARDSIDDKLFKDGALVFDMAAQEFKEIIRPLYDNNILSIVLDDGFYYNGNRVTKFAVKGDDGAIALHEFLTWFSYVITAQNMHGKLMLPPIYLENVANVAKMFTTSTTMYSNRNRMTYGDIELHGFGQVVNASSMLFTCTVHGNITIDSCASLEKSDGMFNYVKSNQTTINVPFNFTNLKDARNMFELEREAKDSIHITGGKLPSMPQLEKSTAMFTNCVFEPALDLDSLSFENVRCNNMFTAAENVKIKSLALGNCQAELMFARTKFVPNTEIKQISITNSRINHIFDDASNIRQVGQIILRGRNEVGARAFYFNDIKSIGFIDIEDAARSGIDDRTFNKDILAQYGCADTEHFVRILDLMSMLRA